MRPLTALLFGMVNLTRLQFGGGGKPPVYAAPPPPAKTATASARTAAAQGSGTTGRPSTILAPRFRQDAPTTKRTIMGSPL